MLKDCYDTICDVCDQVRECDLDLVISFVEETMPHPGMAILDVGCGNGNYSDLVQRVTQARVFGIDPSEAQLVKARARNGRVTFKLGSAMDIPFAAGCFDFVYMIDVVHHLSDLEASMAEMCQVLKTGGWLCIDTQSHDQIGRRVLSEFFPASASAERQRHPDIERIVWSGKWTGLAFAKEKIIGQDREVAIGDEFLDMVCRRGYVMLRQIPDEEYRHGLERLKQALDKGPIRRRTAGRTQVWFMKRGGA